MRRKEINERVRLMKSEGEVAEVVMLLNGEYCRHSKVEVLNLAFDVKCRACGKELTHSEMKRVINTEVGMCRNR